MNKETILNSISNSHSKLSSKCQLDLLKTTKILSLKKGTLLVRDGQFSNKTYYIISGAARAYYLKNGKDISDWFAFENEFISPIISYFTNKPSPHYIELLEDSVLLELTKEDVEMISNKHHDFERLIRIVVTKTMLSLQERISSILFQKAEQRYEQLLKTYPTITQRVSLTHIASYLGITLETLSRIRRPKKRI